MRKSALLATAIACLIGSSPSAARAAPAPCDERDAKTYGELNERLSRKAVEVINRASARDGETDSRLRALVAPDAPFSTGGGDVRIVLDPGVAGARALARDMKADSFRFYGWGGIPMLIEDACGTHKVEVEFVNKAQDSAYPVTFTFRAGRIVEAAGWQRPLNSGPIAPFRD